MCNVYPEIREAVCASYLLASNIKKNISIKVTHNNKHQQQQKLTAYSHIVNLTLHLLKLPELHLTPFALEVHWTNLNYT